VGDRALAMAAREFSARPLPSPRTGSGSRPCGFDRLRKVRGSISSMYPVTGLQTSKCFFLRADRRTILLAIVLSTVGVARCSFRMELARGAGADWPY